MGLILPLAAEGCANRPPILNCVPKQTTVTEGDLVTIQTNATDPDRDSLTHEWSATSGIRSNAVVLSTRNIAPQNGSGVYNSTGVKAGRYTIKAEVSDGKHRVSCSVNVMVEKNKQAPTVACTPSDVRFIEGQSMRVQARASDPNNDPLTYSWEVDDDMITNDQPSFELGTVVRSIGAHTVRITVTDVDNMSATCEFDVTIERRPNRNPAVSLTLDKNQVYGGDTVIAIAQASDPDGDPVTYSWNLNEQPLPETLSRIEINTSVLTRGMHSVRVTARDDQGGSATTIASFSVSEKAVDEAAVESQPSTQEELFSRLWAKETEWEDHVDWVQDQLVACRESDLASDRRPCHQFAAQALEKVYSVIDFKSGGKYLRPSQMRDYITAHQGEWVAIGPATDQQALEIAQSRANEGVPVIAVSPLHAAFILPGQLTPSGSWQLEVPNSASFFPKNPLISYVARGLSHAWRKADSMDVKLYYRAR
ncbi:PKD domain-containing protein [Acidobacteria bacterium AH-259-D05]|nr:PKD domain-containing protein [Acidobacteria bacterium AH-259-D05]